MLYTVDSNADEPIMLLNKRIGNTEEEEGIRGDLFQQELLFLDTLGKKRIQIWINSVGGSVIDGMAIYNTILKTKTKVNTYCCGVAASISAVIFQAGRQRTIADNGLVMIHNPSGGDDKVLNAMRGSLITMIATRCKLTEEKVGELMDKETWFNADECLAEGLADRKEASDSLNIPRLSKTESAVANWEIANSVLNTAAEKLKIKNKMTKVTNALNLNAEANEESIASAILKIKNEAEDRASKLKAAEDAVAAAAAKYKELEDAFKKMKAETEEEKTKAEAAQAVANEKTAVETINSFVKIGKVKNEATAIASWVKLATSDLEGTKAMLEALPVNKAGVKIDISNVADGSVENLTSVAAKTMAAKREALKIQ